MHVHLTEIAPKRITRSLVCVVLGLVCASLVVKTLQLVYGLPHMRALVSTFYVDLESNVPTWYSAFALLLASALLGVIAYAKHHQRDAYRRHWMVLAGLFFGLSVDEVAMFHELPILPLRAALNAKGILYYTWVVPGMVAVAVLGVGFATFLKSLPSRTRLFFVLAGCLYVGGAIGIEMLSGHIAYGHGEETLGYMLVVTLEELMEMLGVVVFIHALLEYLNSTFGELHVTFDHPNVGSDRPQVVS